MPAERVPRRSLPVTVIGGYLGAGKTTLVNQLLRAAGGRRIAVLVNEFGALPIDGDLIAGAEGNLLTLAGGCICCSYGDDLLNALADLVQRADTLDHVLIEASGVALPASIAGALSLLAGFDLSAVVVMADAETVRERAADRYIGDTITRQLVDADLVVVNKADLVGDDALVSVQSWVSTVAPAARVVVAARGAVPADVVLGIDVDSRFKAGDRPAHHHSVAFDSVSLKIEGAVDAAALAERLAAPALGLARAKGFVLDRDGRWKTIQISGKRAAVTTAPQHVTHGRLVCIATQRVNRAFVEQAIMASAAPR